MKIWPFIYENTQKYDDYEDFLFISVLLDHLADMPIYIILVIEIGLLEKFHRGCFKTERLVGEETDRRTCLDRLVLYSSNGI